MSARHDRAPRVLIIGSGFAGIGFGQQQVGADRVVEQMRALREQGDAGTHALRRQRRDVDALDAVASDAHALAVNIHRHARLAQFQNERVEMIRARAASFMDAW